ncbi:MAG: ParB/RepB/Spo0J family partition protein [Ignavibacteriae bacterium]|nr:ParB/RepB/Spo0J family partition protein [Ignavibacteriota bacterium]MCB9216413.1 ParB/RepB/Spo0J family partition protein [Ignavibacteria bacterium]
MAKKSGLGRGLGALLNPTLTQERRQALPIDDGYTVGTICKIDITRVTPNRYQPRLDFNRQALEELKKSILEKGVIQPITVRRYGDGFELISGERRVRASSEAGLTEIPAYILDVDSDREMLELALIENVQRENLNPIEVALGYQRLIRECDLTQEQVAERVGKDRSTVTNLLRLLRLPEPIQNSLRAGEVSMGHARALLTIQEEDRQIEVWQTVRDEGLSVRRTEALVKKEAGQNGYGAKKKEKPQKTEPKGMGGEVELTIAEISSRLRQVLGTQVKIKANDNGSGAIAIDFYTLEDLERLLELFAIIERNA